MAWGENLRFAGAFAKRAVLGNPEGKTLLEKWKDSNQERLDKNLPLGIKIGARIQLDTTADFIIAQDELCMPEAPEKGTIYQIGTFDFGRGMKTTRAYFSAPGADGTFAQVAFLQVDSQRESIGNVRLFVQIEEMGIREQDGGFFLVDSSGEEYDLDEWLNEEQGILGAPEFYMPNPQNEEDSVTFHRLNQPNANRILREERIEKLLGDPFGEDREEVHCTAADYHRELDNDYVKREYLILRLAEGDHEAGVEIYVGIDVSQSAVDII